MSRLPSETTSLLKCNKGEGLVMNLKNTTYWSLFGDIWGFFKKYYDTPRNWEQLMSECNMIYSKYKETQIANFSGDLLISCVDELERRDKSEQKP